LTVYYRGGKQDPETTNNEDNMSKITKTYSNAANGGKECVTRDGSSLYVSSDWGSGFCAPTKVSASDMRRCLAHTSAPAEVVEAMLGDK
jgi:hypothetical protein